MLTGNELIYFYKMRLPGGNSRKRWFIARKQSEIIFNGLVIALVVKGCRSGCVIVDVFCHSSFTHQRGCEGIKFRSKSLEMYF